MGQVELGAGLHPGWLPKPQSSLWPSKLAHLFACWVLAGSGQEAQEREPRSLAHRLAARVCKGAGYSVTASSSQGLPDLAPGHPLPAFLLPPLSTVLQLRIHRRYQDPSKWGTVQGREINAFLENYQKFCPGFPASNLMPFQFQPLKTLPQGTFPDNPGPQPPRSWIPHQDPRQEP